jgi:hypothetical protein
MKSTAFVLAKFHWAGSFWRNFIPVKQALRLTGQVGQADPMIFNPDEIGFAPMK